MQDDFRKKVLETKFDIFPFDKLLPIETVYSIFKDIYEKEGEKVIFFERKYQRLREGYFGIFTAISLVDCCKKEYFIIFPTDPQNDFFIGYERKDSNSNNPKLNMYSFDVKEYTKYSKNFSDFVKRAIKSKLSVYNIIIASYNDMDGDDLESLIKELKGTSFRVWIIASPSNSNFDYKISQITIIDQHGIMYNKKINLDDWIKEGKLPIIFQDNLRYKDSKN